jgi:hypothetical protein
MAWIDLICCLFTAEYLLLLLLLFLYPCVRVDRYGVSRSEILDRTEGGGEMAVRLAIGEAHVIQENRDYFSSHGVDLGALESHASNSKASARSTTTLLIKNLPHDVIEEELESMFGRYRHYLIVEHNNTNSREK